MFINLLLVSRECLSGQQPLERAIYVSTTKNSLKTQKDDLSFYGETEQLPCMMTPSEGTISDCDSISSTGSCFPRPRTKTTCEKFNGKHTSLNKEDVWLMIYADSLGCDPFECDCEKY